MINLFRKNQDPQDLKQVVTYLKKLEKENKELRKELEELKEKGAFALQKVSTLRFNPFSGVGGDQSFCIALLDKNNDGAVITSLFTREGNRVYGKPIKAGQSEYTLSDEEKQVLKKAIA